MSEITDTWGSARAYADECLRLGSIWRDTPGATAITAAMLRSERVPEEYITRYVSKCGTLEPQK